LYFFNSSDESVTQLNATGYKGLLYYEEIDDEHILFMCGAGSGSLYYMNMNDGTFTYKSCSSSRTVIKGTNKYLIVSTNSNSGGGMFLTSADLSDFANFSNIAGSTNIFTTVKQTSDGSEYTIYARNFDDKNFGTITEYVFSTGKDQLVMVTAKNIDEIFQS
jgi:ribosomal protein S4E